MVQTFMDNMRVTSITKNNPQKGTASYLLTLASVFPQQKNTDNPIHFQAAIRAWPDMIALIDKLDIKIGSVIGVTGVPEEIKTANWMGVEYTMSDIWISEGGNYQQNNNGVENRSIHTIMENMSVTDFVRHTTQKGVFHTMKLRSLYPQKKRNNQEIYFEADCIIPARLNKTIEHFKFRKGSVIGAICKPQLYKNENNENGTKISVNYVVNSMWISEAPSHSRRDSKQTGAENTKSQSQSQTQAQTQAQEEKKATANPYLETANMLMTNPFG